MPGILPSRQIGSRRWRRCRAVECSAESHAQAIEMVQLVVVVRDIVSRNGAGRADHGNPIFIVLVQGAARLEQMPKEISAFEFSSGIPPAAPFFKTEYRRRPVRMAKVSWTQAGRALRGEPLLRNPCQLPRPGRPAGNRGVAGLRRRL